MDKNSLEYLESLPWDVNDKDTKAKYFEKVCALAIEEWFDWAEFGTGTGKTARLLLQHRGNRWIHFFDSFQGIPDAWKFSEDCEIKKGTSAHKFPHEVISGPRISVYPGLFAETVFWFAQIHDCQLGLIHIDCDIYSSTKDVLSNIRGLIGFGTIIMFDEFFNYPNFAEHEYKAFMEFIADTQRQFEYVARGETQAAVRIL